MPRIQLVPNSAGWCPMAIVVGMAFNEGCHCLRNPHVLREDASESSTPHLGTVLVAQALTMSDSEAISRGLGLALNLSWTWSFHLSASRRRAMRCFRHAPRGRSAPMTLFSPWRRGQQRGSGCGVRWPQGHVARAPDGLVEKSAARGGRQHLHLHAAAGGRGDDVAASW